MPVKVILFNPLTTKMKMAINKPTKRRIKTPVKMPTPCLKRMKRTLQTCSMLPSYPADPT